MSNNISDAFTIDGAMFGCDEPKRMSWPVIALVLVVCLLLFYYFTREGVCGGKDQLCQCDAK
jgi:hypothetical protein